MGAVSGTAAGVPGNSDNAVALANLASTSFASGGTRTASEAYSDIVGDVGMRTANAAMGAEMQEAITSQVFALRESESGVSLDEEMVALTKYQRAYEAAAMVLQTADELLQELMARVGR